MSLQLLFSVQLIYAFLLITLINYVISGVCMFFYWGRLGIKGLFYLSELILVSVFVSLLAALTTVIRYGIIVDWTFGILPITDNTSIVCSIHADMLALLCGSLVVLLTMLSLTFGVEYLTREPVAHNTVVTMVAFSSTIVWFIFAYDLGFMIIIWELAGFFSIILVESYYSRIRTTQAVSRTFAISRLSDYFLLLALAEVNAISNSSYLPTLFAAINKIGVENSVIFSYATDLGVLTLLGITLFAAACCKCAQFVLFVWLPDAMEAPTPASALIHSSTLVVMGVFMILRFSPVYNANFVVNLGLLACGCATIVYGAIASVQTGDLKKAVAYSTISQVGYLICGCGMLALKETLIYLIVHAICKAMLFVFVGYTVHLFGGTTSLRKMGGVYAIIPHVTVYVFTLCIILMGYPLTTGYVAKELLISKVFTLSFFLSNLAVLCWMLTICLAPVYLFRVCLLPYFGFAKASVQVYRSLLSLDDRVKYFAMASFDMSKISNPLLFFSFEWKDLTITSRVTALLHFIVMTAILFLGETIFYIVLGVFNTDHLFGFGSTVSPVYDIVAPSLLTAALTMHKVQIFTVVVFITVTAYFALNIYSLRSAYIVFAIIILTQSSDMLATIYYAIRDFNFDDYIFIANTALDEKFGEAAVIWCCILMKFALLCRIAK